jgi:hypothetical protein
VTLILETRVQLRGAGRQEDRRDVFGHVELAGDVPSSSVKEHHGVCALGDVARDFVEVELHHVGVGIGKRPGRSDAPRWADRAEQIRVVMALIGGLSRSGSAPGPLADEAVLLTDPSRPSIAALTGAGERKASEMVRRIQRSVLPSRAASDSMVRLGLLVGSSSQ